MRSRVTGGAVIAGLFLAALGSGCGKTRPLPSALTAGPQVAITGASVDAANRVVVRYTLSQGGQGIGGPVASALGAQWTLAGLSTDPVTSSLPAEPQSASTPPQARPPVPAWRSYLLTGGETLTSLPISGPGSQVVLANARQPGSESGGTVQDLGNGTFSYTFQNALPPGFDPTQTLRVGVWLAGTPGTPQTTSTFDFVPSGGPAQMRELVLDSNCNKCHGLVQAHGGFRTGTKICLTCHTYQNADADTVDPAALATATVSTNPNPLDMGRLVHRIHRGKNLPTLYQANATVPNATRANISLPFNPSRNTPLVGRKYSVVGFESRETVYGQIVSRTDNGQPATAFATGVAFPQDLRNCDACHGGAAQSTERFSDISRRTCQGCHADVWFQDPALITDQVHFMHAGGAQPDDSACYGCHLPRTEVSPIALVGTPDADITAAHVAPFNSSSWNGLTAQIVSVQNMLPGQAPTVLFTLADRDGVLSPLGSPTPAADPASPIGRALSLVAITISGPTSPDFLTGNFSSLNTTPITEPVPLTTTANGSGQFSYTFSARMPANAVGTWAVAIEALRSSPATTPSTPFYDPPSDSFFWPFTGEALAEYADNPLQYVDVGVGSAPGGSPAPRRQVVSRESCNGCHLSLTAHGDLRHNVDYCAMCHAPDATDWASRPKGPSGDVNLDATFDDIEERSLHFKVLVHRIHTGGRTGSAELDLARPLVVYGDGGPRFFDQVRFPNDLSNCALCHQGNTWEIESVPPGALGTLANETATIQHQGTAAHGAGETRTPPVQAACMGCHDTGAALFHAQQNTVSGVEQCAQCHGLGIGGLSLDAVHRLPR